MRKNEKNIFNFFGNIVLLGIGCICIFYSANHWEVVAVEITYQVFELDNNYFAGVLGAGGMASYLNPVSYKSFASLDEAKEYLTSLDRKGKYLIIPVFEVK